jgi:hypothetical protein
VSTKQYGQNLSNPVLEVQHAALKRWSEESMYKSVCPVCPDGLLLVGRELKTFCLSELDRCVVCGQLIRYLDIETLRQRERGSVLSTNPG